MQHHPHPTTPLRQNNLQIQLGRIYESKHLTFSFSFLAFWNTRWIGGLDSKLTRRAAGRAPNLVLLDVAKYFICKCFLNEKSLDFELYKLQLGEKALTEQFIATKNNTITVFYNKWQPFMSKNFISDTVWRGRTSITPSRITIIVISSYLSFLFCLDSNKCMFLSDFFKFNSFTLVILSLLSIKQA